MPNAPVGAMPALLINHSLLVAPAIDAQVIAGPGRNPGAVAVEDERGRVVLLGKSRKVRLNSVPLLLLLLRCDAWLWQ